MANLPALSDLERDALREVANIGAGHAATALSQMTGRKIMISVPEVSVRALEQVAELVGPPDSCLGGVLVHLGATPPGGPLVGRGRRPPRALSPPPPPPPPAGPGFDAM